MGSFDQRGLFRDHHRPAETVSAQMRGQGGYAYLCDGPAQLQAVKEDSGHEV